MIFATTAVAVDAFMSSNHVIFGQFESGYYHGVQ